LNLFIQGLLETIRVTSEPERKPKWVKYSCIEAMIKPHLIELVWQSFLQARIEPKNAVLGIRVETVNKYPLNLRSNVRLIVDHLGI